MHPHGDASRDTEPVRLLTGAARCDGLLRRPDADFPEYRGDDGVHELEHRRAHYLGIVFMA
jgi:hypothetical protein